MRAILLPNGRIRIPRRAESEDGRTLGDGVVDIGPGDESYTEWLAWLQSKSAAAKTDTGEEPAPAGKD